MNDVVEFRINYVGNMLIGHIRANLYICAGAIMEGAEGASVTEDHERRRRP